jgi:hypothetical protein
VYTSDFGTRNRGAAHFWAKKTHRLTEFGNRKFSIFRRAVKRKWDAQLEIEVIRESKLEIPVGSTGNTCLKSSIDIYSSNTFQSNDMYEFDITFRINKGMDNL